MSLPRAFQTVSLVTALCVAGPAARLPAADFIRGDLNGDGAVSLADAYFLGLFLFQGGSPGGCIGAGDANDDGDLNVTDEIFIANYVVLGGNAPPSPFPAPGPDPTENSSGILTCDSYGGGAPLDDPAAELAVLDAVAQGGADASAVITIRVSHSTSIAGYSGKILVDSAVVGGILDKPADLSGSEARTEFAAAKLTSGRLTFGFVCSLSIGGDPWIPPGEDSDVLAISVCLKNGAPAGEYPLSLSAGELIDAASGRAIGPVLASGTLTVLEAVTSTACEEHAACTEPAPAPQPAPPELNTSFSLADAVGVPGGTAAVPFSIYADAEVQGYSFSVDFDEEVLEAVSVEAVFQAAPGSDGFRVFQFNNRNDNPGSAGVDEGFIVGAMVFSFRDHCHNMPANKSNLALRFHMNVNPDTDATSTEVKFIDGGRGGGDPIHNMLTAMGHGYTPDVATSFVFVNGVVNVQPDIATFVRGDANGDEKVDISDAQSTLGYLFLGSARPDCYDAADANDTGLIDISDPIETLNYLFMGRGALPAPFPALGEDPTEDSLGCQYRS